MLCRLQTRWLESKNFLTALNCQGYFVYYIDNTFWGNYFIFCHDRARGRRELISYTIEVMRTSVYRMAAALSPSTEPKLP